jgi:type IX secretion system substrate protein/BNR repeat protein
MKNVLKVVFVLVVLLAFFSSDLFTQDEPVEKIYQTYYLDSIEVTVSPNFRPWPGDYVTQSEFSIDVHPQNENIIFFSANATDWPYTELYGSGVYWSLDGGANWEGYDIPPFGETETDPAVVIDINGNFYVNFMDTVVSFPLRQYGQGIAISTDSGAYWIRDTVAKISTGGALDKNHIMIDKSHGSLFTNRLYCGWLAGSGPNINDIEVRYLPDIDSSWSSSINISSDLSAGKKCMGVNLQIAANGDVYATYAVFDNVQDHIEDAIGFSKSIDGGHTWSAARIYTHANFGIFGSIKNSHINVNSFPSMAVDRSGGAHDGSIYICWTQRNAPPAGSDPDIVLIKSTDGGTTWISPIRVNDDPINNSKDQYFPWITVDQSTGNVMMVFYDSRDVSNELAEAWMAVSTDGGSIWQNFKVSDTPFMPFPIGAWSPGYQGDYLGIVALNNVAYPIWADNRIGHPQHYQAWMSKVTFGPTTSVDPPLNSNTPLKFVLEQNYPNPFNPVTTINYSIPKKGYVLLKVYDVLGNEIKTLVKDEKAAGNHKIEFDASNLASGIYLFNIQIGSEYSETKKMILMR